MDFNFSRFPQQDRLVWLQRLCSLRESLACSLSGPSQASDVPEQIRWIRNRTISNPNLRQRVTTQTDRQVIRMASLEKDGMLEAKEVEVEGQMTAKVVAGFSGSAVSWIGTLSDVVRV